MTGQSIVILGGGVNHLVLGSSYVGFSVSDTTTMADDIRDHFTELGVENNDLMSDFRLFPNPVNNAANLSLFMVTVSRLLVQPFRQDSPDFGVLDLKAHFRGRKYVAETLKLLPETPDPILLLQVFDTVAQLGCIHPVEPCFSSP